MNYYSVFSNAFPELNLSEKAFYEISKINSSKVFCCNEGFAVVSENNLILICVFPEFQRSGIGSELFRQAENYIRSQGCSAMNVGGTSSELFIGASEESKVFFEKMGCRFDGCYEEMSGDIKNFHADDYDFSCDDNISFDFFKGDKSVIENAVAAVDKDWVQYFGDDSDIFCAYSDGEIASFCLLDYDIECLVSDGVSRVGSVGCVGTVPRYRRKGIGLKMVAEASEILKNEGCDKCFIHFTGVAHWYSRLGYKTFLKQWLGGKSL